MLVKVLNLFVYTFPTFHFGPDFWIFLGFWSHMMQNGLWHTFLMIIFVVTWIKYANFRFKNFWISAVLHFVSQWVGWEETKLLHFSIWRLFDALTILEYDMYQFMAVTLRYVTILKFIYRILKPIFLWNF